MSRYAEAASLGPLWQREQPRVNPFLDHVIADQLEHSDPEYDLLSHSIHVRNLAYYIALKIDQQFANSVDPDLVATASLIHDWGKIKQQPTINKPYEHFVRSQFDAAMHDFPATGSIAGRHNFGALITQDPIPLEQMIIIYSDIRARTEYKEKRAIRKYSSLETALSEIKEKLIASNVYTQDDFLAGSTRLRKFEVMLKKYDIDLDDLSQLPDGFSSYNRKFYNSPPLISAVRQDEKDFLTDLSAQGITTLSQEQFQKAAHYRSVVKDVVTGDINAAEKLGLIDISRMDQWVHVLTMGSEMQLAEDIHTHLDTYLSILSNASLLPSLRINYMNTLWEHFDSLSQEQQDLTLSAIKNIFLDQSQPEDVLASAARVYGDLLAKYSIYQTPEALEQLWELYDQNVKHAHSPITLSRIALSDRSLAQTMLTRLQQKDAFSIMGINGLNFYKDLLLFLDDPKNVQSISQFDNTVHVIPNIAEVNTSMDRAEQFRRTYVLGELLHSNNIQMRREARDGLMNLHQVTTDPSIKVYIRSILDNNAHYDRDIVTEFIERLLTVDDPIEKQALCEIIGKSNLDGHKRLVAKAFQSLLTIINGPDETYVKTSALQALGKDGMVKYFTVDQADEIMQNLWHIFYFNPAVRSLLPETLAQICSTRPFYPKMSRDIERMETIIRRENHPDQQLQYDATRFFVHLAATLPSDTDPLIKLAQKSILISQTVSPVLFDIAFHDYTSALLRSDGLEEDKKLYRLASLVKKLIATASGDLAVRTATYKQLSGQSLSNFLGDEEDVVFFIGTFDPIHKGGIAVAEHTSNLVGTVYLQVDSGNPLKQPKTMSIRKTITSQAIVDLPNVFLFNDAEPFNYRKPEDYAELKRVFPGKTIWILVGQDRLSAEGSYYTEEGHYVFEVPHVLTIREGNFPPCVMELQNGRIVGDVQPELLKYLQSNDTLLKKINKFNRIKVVGIPTNFSSTDTKKRIERGVLTDVASQTIGLIAHHYADPEFLEHIATEDMISRPGHLDLLRENDALLTVPKDQADQMYDNLSAQIPLPERSMCNAFYDPLTGYVYLCEMKGLRTGRILQVFEKTKTVLKAI